MWEVTLTLLIASSPSPSPINTGFNPGVNKPGVNQGGALPSTGVRQSTQQQSQSPVAQSVPFVDLIIDADSASYQGSLTIYEGYVEARLGGMRLQCDRFVVDDEAGRIEAQGNVIYDQEGQRITGSRAVFDVKTRKGSIWDATGFTDRTPDGVSLQFEAARIERTGLDRFVVHDGLITSCQDAVPKWSFQARQIGLTLNRRVTVRSPTFKIKNLPAFWLPYASVPITKRDRSSGFLTPSLGSSNVRGRSVTIPYYQTLGPSADILPRVEVYTQRGIGVGADFRSRAGPTSHLDTGFFAVFDRLFGQDGPDQGGTAFYLDAVQRLPEGFLFAADINITSNLFFRQIFSDDFNEAISPEERTQIYLNNNFRSFSFNLLAQSRDVIIPDQLVTIRQLPVFEFSSRPRQLDRRAPIYLSFRAAAEGLSRAESTFKTPSVVQRLDFKPRLTIPLPSLGGWRITPAITLRTTFYSNSNASENRIDILGESVHRNYLELSVDLRPPALERVFHHRDGARWFKHVIEPVVTYRRIVGVGSEFSRIIRFDEHDTIANTNEVELALVNRFFVTRENPSGDGQQAHEWLTIKLAQQYFSDPTFDGALVEGQRNQLDPINRLTGFSFGGTARRFSPLSARARVRPLSSLFADVRLDYDTREHFIRNVSLTAGLQRDRLTISQSWHLTRRVPLRAGVFEPGTFPADLYQTSVLLGSMDRGLFAGFDVLYDFTNRTIAGTRTTGRLVSSTIRFGYAFDCCSLQIQNTTFKIGERNEKRLAFSFTLSGIGSFGRHTSAGQRIFGP